MKASDLFLRCLEEEGVDTIFGVPGEENSDLMISLLNSSIEFVVCRHEQSASFMADMYGRLTGKPGICLATLGPGATNLLTGVASANMDKVPLIAIIGQASTLRLHKESHQNMNALEMYEPVTKWASSIRDCSVIPETIRKAFKVAISPKPGAVLIELPEDIAKKETDAEPLPRTVGKEKTEEISFSALDKTLNLIAESKMPILLVGYGASFANADPEIKQFMDQTGIYAATTFMGKGTVSAHHPQSLYTVGLGMKDIAIEAFDKADLIIAVGYGMVEWHPERWNEGKKKKIIHIDVAPAEVDKNYLPEVELIGPIPSILRMLNQSINFNKKSSNYFADIRNRCTLELLEHEKDQGFPVKPQRALNDIRKCMGAEDILISDVGAHKMWVARQYPAYHSKSCFIFNGFCSMGGALPGAFTAKKLFPEKNVIALCGDGGFIMSIQALVSAVQFKLPIVVILWDDNAYGLIKWKQEMEYHKYSHVELVNPDLEAVARSFGCQAITIKNTEELIPSIKKGFAEKNKPTVIIVPIDYSENMKLTERLGKLVSH